MIATFHLEKYANDQNLKLIKFCILCDQNQRPLQMSYMNDGKEAVNAVSIYSTFQTEPLFSRSSMHFIFEIFLICIYLFLNSFFICLSGNRPDNSQGNRIFRISHICQHILNSGIWFECIMNQNILFSNAIFTKLYNLEFQPVKNQSFVIILSE